MKRPLALPVFLVLAVLLAVGLPWTAVASNSSLPFFEPFDGDITSPDHEPVVWSTGGDVPGIITTSNGQLIIENSGDDTSVFVAPEAGESIVPYSDVTVRTPVADVGER